MKKLHLIETTLCIGLSALAPVASAEEFSTTLKPENLQQAIAFEKAKDRADDQQAAKETHGSQPRGSQTSQKKTPTSAKTTTGRTPGQSDSSSKK